jgi:hypothetical protein
LVTKVNILGDRLMIEEQVRSLFDVVGLLRGDRLCGGNVDVLGDRSIQF